MTNFWPEKMNVYVIIERVDGNERLVAVYSENSLEDALEWGKGEFDEFHAADPGTDNCAFLSKKHGVRMNLS